MLQGPHNALHQRSNLLVDVLQVGIVGGLIGSQHTESLAVQLVAIEPVVQHLHVQVASLTPVQR